MVQMRLKNSLTSNTATLYRQVNGRVRYYRIKVYLTLFGDYLLVREWGRADSKRATGQKQRYFTNLVELTVAVKNILFTKEKKGYIKVMK